MVFAILLAATPAAATTYHVASTTSGASDANDCLSNTANHSCLTIQGGINKAASGAGHTVQVDDSATYTECVTIRKSGASQAAPWTLDLGTATINGDGGTCAGGAVSGSCNPASIGGAATIMVNDNYAMVSYVRIKNGTVVPPGDHDSAATRGYGVYFGCVDYGELNGTTFSSIPTRTDGATSNTGNALVGVYDGSYLVVKNVTATPGALTTDWHFLAGNDDSIEMYRNTVSKLGGGFFCVSNASQKADIAYNNIASMGSVCDGPGNGNLIQAYNQGALSIRYNLFNANSYYITALRSYSFSTRHPVMVFSNNTAIGTSTNNAINACKDSDPAPNGPVGLVMRNNVFKSYAYAIRIDVPDSAGSCFTTCGDLNESNNAYYGATGFLDNANSASCAYGSIPAASTTVPGSDPLSANCPQATTNSIIDSGSASAPVPTGGGSTVDKGACESGTAGGAWANTYTFQNEETASSATPTISWAGGTTANLDIVELDFITALAGAAQTKYRCEVDSALTFDSQGIAKPYWTSGDVTSGTQSCAVGTSLTDGNWFARVRVNDGPWSAVYPFLVGAAPAATRRRQHVMVAK